MIKANPEIRVQFRVQFFEKEVKTVQYDIYSSPNDPEFLEDLKAMTEDEEDNENAQWSFIYAIIFRLIRIP